MKLDRSRHRSIPVLALAVVAALCAAPSSAAPFGARSFKSGPIQITADGRVVWVANPDNDSLSRIDTGSDAVLEIPLPAPGPHAPHGVSLREDGSEVWVACRDSDRVFVLRGSDGALLAEIALPWGSGPYGIALSRDQRWALVTLKRAPGIALLDVASHSLRQVLDVTRFFAPVGVAWTEDGVSAWVTHTLSASNTGDPFLSRIEVGASGARLTTKLRLPLTGPGSSGGLAPPYQIAEGGYLTLRGQLAQIPSASGRNELWLPVQHSNFFTDYSPDSTAQSAFRHIDLTSRSMKRTLADRLVLSAVYVHDPTMSGSPYVGPGWNVKVSGVIDIGFDADGATLYALGEQSNNLIVIPTDTPPANLTGAPPLTAIDVGARPIGLALSPVAASAYVANQLSRDVSVIDLVAQRETRRIPTTPLTGERWSPSIVAGAKIFHASVDALGRDRISSNGKMACATCHPDAEQDGAHWGFSNLPGDHGTRQTLSLRGLGRSFTNGERDPINGVWGELHRSGDRDEIQDFEWTFQSPLMGGTGFLGPAANPELGAPNAGRDPDLDALAAYLLWLPPPPRSPYRTATGALSESAIRGATFFMGSDYPTRRADSACASCHIPGEGYLDHTSHDVGQARDSAEEELGSRVPAWHVNTPSLIGAWATPPWSGVTSSVVSGTIGADDMVNLIKDQAAQTRHGTPRGLTGRQIADLANFVLSIDGNLSVVEVVAARDTKPPRIVRVEPVSLTLVDVWFNETVASAGASDPTSYSIVDVDSGTPVPVTAVTWDAQNGDLVRLTVALPATCGSFRLTPAPGARIFDTADWASGGRANALLVTDPANSHEFAIGSTLTITLGDSGYEHLTIPIHDVSFIPGNGVVQYREIDLMGMSVNKGLLRFDWRAAVVAATGLASSADIVAAGFTLEGSYGDAQPLALRRVLRPWKDPKIGSANGATWSYNDYPTSLWNANNAAVRSAGIDGKSPSDYDGRNDLGFTPDLTLTPAAVNGRTTFAGAGISDAYRFWFDNTSLDYGFAIEQTSSNPNVFFFRTDMDASNEHGPVLTISYRLPVAASAEPGEVSRVDARQPLYAVKATDELRLSFQDLGPAATAYNIYEGSLGTWFSHEGAACNVMPPAAAGRRAWTHRPAPGSRYFQVTAANPCAEGPAAAGWPTELLDCPP